MHLLLLIFCIISGKPTQPESQTAWRNAQNFNDPAEVPLQCLSGVISSINEKVLCGFHGTLWWRSKVVRSRSYASLMRLPHHAQRRTCRTSMACSTSLGKGTEIYCGCVVGSQSSACMVFMRLAHLLRGAVKEGRAHAVCHQVCCMPAVHPTQKIVSVLANDPCCFSITTNRRGVLVCST